MVSSTPSSLSHRTTLALCLATVYLIWGASFLATKIGIAHLPPFLFGGVRFLVGGLILLAIALALGRRPRLDLTELRHIAAVSFGIVFMAIGCNNWALQWMPSNQTALLNATVSVWLALFAMHGARAHQPGPLEWTGTALGLAGTALIVLPDAQHAGAHLSAQLVILLGVMVSAASTIYYRNAGTRLDLLSFTAVQMLCGGLMLTVAGIAMGELPRWQWTAAGFWPLAYLTVFSACIAYSAYAWLARHATPAQIGSYAYVNPAIATLLGWLVLDERLDPTRTVGTVVILAGVVLVNWPARPAISSGGDARRPARR